MEGICIKTSKDAQVKVEWLREDFPGMTEDIKYKEKLAVTIVFKFIKLIIKLRLTGHYN